MTGRPRRFADDAGAFLLGALAERGAGLVRAPHESCPDCRDEVERLRPAADALPRSVEQLDAADRLRASIMDAVERRGRAPRRRGRRAAARASGCRVAPVRPALAGAIARPGARSPAFGVAGWRAARRRHDRREVDDAGSRRQRARVEGDGDDGAALAAAGMPTRRAGRVYQVWIATGDKIAPAPTFVADRDGSGVGRRCPSDLSGADAVLVTRERRGGPCVADGEMPVHARRSLSAPPLVSAGRWRRATGIRAARRACRCSNCGRPICPDCMTADPGRHALPRVRAPAHPGARDPRPSDEPTLTYILIGINVLVALGGILGGASATGGGSGGSSLLQDGAVSRPGDRRRRVLAARHRRLPARRASSTCSSTCSRSTSSAGCSSRRWGSCASGSSTSCRCSPARSARCCSSPTRSTVGASGADLRPDGRGGGGDAQPRDQPHGERARHLDRAQPR